MKWLELRSGGEGVLIVCILVLVRKDEAMLPTELLL